MVFLLALDRLSKIELDCCLREFAPVASLYIHCKAILASLLIKKEINPLEQTRLKNQLGAFPIQ
jgi:hypothetical protein